MRPLPFSGEPYALLFWTVFAFWIFMEANASRSKRARRNTKASARDRGSLWLIVILFWIGLSLSFSLCYLLPKAAIHGNQPMLFFLGTSLLLAGIAFRWHAMSVLGKFFTVDVAVHSDHAPVDSGPYRYLRHPSYTGALITQAGFGLALGNWAAFFALLLFNRRHLEQPQFRQRPGAHKNRRPGAARGIHRSIRHRNADQTNQRPRRLTRNAPLFPKRRHC